MQAQHLAQGLLGGALALALAAATPSAAAVTVGVPLPIGSMAARAESAEPIRQSLISQFGLQSIKVVPLAATAGAALDAEAKATLCDYVLYTRLEEKHGSGGVFSKLSSFGSGLSFGATGGGGDRSIASARPPSSPGDAAPGSLKRGDSVALDYRLVAVGASQPLKADSLTGKASVDGEDVLGPLFARLAAAVSASAGAPTPDMGPQAGAAAQPQHASAFSGLFGHKSAPPPTAGSQMDCAQIAALGAASNGYALPVSVADCQTLKAAQQTYNQAGTDPSAVHAGDESMSCEQIMAELKRQPLAPPDPDKAAAYAAAAGDMATDLKHTEAVAAKLQAEDQAIADAAMAADRATALATGGLVQGRNMQAADKLISERDEAANRELLKESMPTQQRLNHRTADLASDLSGQLQSNPRLARLMQLAGAKHCKGG